MSTPRLCVDCGICQARNGDARCSPCGRREREVAARALTKAEKLATRQNRYIEMHACFLEQAAAKAREMRQYNAAKRVEAVGRLRQALAFADETDRIRRVDTTDVLNISELIGRPFASPLGVAVSAAGFSAPVGAPPAAPRVAPPIVLPPDPMDISELSQRLRALDPGPGPAPAPNLNDLMATANSAAPVVMTVEQAYEWLRLRCSEARIPLPEGALKTLQDVPKLTMELIDQRIADYVSKHKATLSAPQADTRVPVALRA